MIVIILSPLKRFNSFSIENFKDCVLVMPVGILCQSGNDYSPRCLHVNRDIYDEFSFSI